MYYRINIEEEDSSWIYFSWFSLFLCVTRDIVFLSPSPFFCNRSLCCCLKSLKIRKMNPRVPYEKRLIKKKMFSTSLQQADLKHNGNTAGHYRETRSRCRRRQRRKKKKKKKNFFSNFDTHPRRPVRLSRINRERHVPLKKKKLFFQGE
jgi:hypothetical protein